MTLPPLLAIPEGRKARPRKAPPYRPKEDVLHKSVATLLKQTAHRDWRWTCFPAGEHRNIRTGEKLKAMGLNKGWPDFIIVSPRGMIHFLELKRQGEGLTVEQQDLQTWAAAHGVPFSVADSFALALAALQAWGALRPLR